MASGWKPPREWALRAVFVFGFSAMLGDALGFAPLKGIGVASMAAPLPKVFSAVDGWETFAADFVLVLEHSDGRVEERRLTPQIYSRLSGPYNRRNVYGAALAYAPRLPRAIWEPPYCFGLAPEGPLRKEFGIPAEARLRLRLTAHTAGRDETVTLDPECAP
jgi:hypothetical protein